MQNSVALGRIAENWSHEENVASFELSHNYSNTKGRTHVATDTVVNALMRVAEFGYCRAT